VSKDGSSGGRAEEVDNGSLWGKIILYLKSPIFILQEARSHPRFLKGNDMIRTRMHELEQKRRQEQTE
jgi:hypothetical protein